MELSEYQNRFKTVEVSRNADGMLTLRMHSRGESLYWGGLPHRELAELFGAVASDRENRVVVLTGTGDTFIGLKEGPEGLAQGRISPAAWEHIIWEGNRLIHQHLDIDVPMIAAVNGPAIAHSELAVLCDIVLAADHAYFQDAPHFPGGLVPGDGMQVIWPLLLGQNRGRYFLLTGEKLAADEAQRLGVVGEVLPPDKLLERAYELAAGLAQRNPILLRHTRAVLTRPLKRAMSDDLHLGLALEGLASLSGARHADASSR